MPSLIYIKYFTRCIVGFFSFFFLDVDIPPPFAASWNLPISSSYRNFVHRDISEGWQFSFYHSPPTLVGVLQFDQIQEMAILERDHEVYLVFCFMVDRIPFHIHTIHLELDGALCKEFSNALLSPWTKRYEVRNVEFKFRKFNMVHFGGYSTRVVILSWKLKRYIWYLPI